MKWLKYLLIVILVSKISAQQSDFESINFKTADSIAIAYEGESLDNLPQLAFNLSSNLSTDVEKFRAIFKWVTSNIKNDYSLYLKIKRRKYRFKKNPAKLEAWNLKLKKEVFKTLLDDRRTICTGYAYLVKELANLADIPCKIVNGYGRTSTIGPDELTLPNHSWNVVKLQNKWYLCDATWASGIPNPTTQRFNFHYNDGLFLADPKLFSINHFPVDEKWLLTSDTSRLTYQEFVEGPIFYNSAFVSLQEHINPEKLRNVINKGDSLNFEFYLTENIDKSDILIMKGSDENAIKLKPENFIIENRKVYMNFTFNNVGTYDIHLFIKNKLISSYTVVVIS